MDVTVKFFSYLRVIVGTDKLNMELPEGATIADLMDKLRCTLGKPDLGKESTVYMMNQEQAAVETALKDKDEITLLYLIGGG